MGVIAIARSARHAKEKKSSHGKTAVVIIVLLVIAAAAFVVFLNRGTIFKGVSGGQTPAAATQPAENADVVGEAFTYENGSGQVFTMNGDNLAIASGTGLQILDTGGQSLYREIFYMRNPAASSCGDYSVFYDVGGTELKYCKSGECKSLENTAEIISAQINSRGWFAVNTGETGYKGSVTVYNAQGKSVYKWSSGSGYTLDAAVSPDCTTLAVLCLDETGSYVKLFKLSSEKEYGTAAISGKTCFRLSYLSGGGFCVLSDSDIEFYSGDGKLRNATDFAGAFLAGFELSDELCAVVLSGYETGSNVTLTGFAPDGGVTGSAALEEEPVSLSCQGQQLLVYMGDKAVLHNRDMSVGTEKTVTPGYKCALLRRGGDALLLSAFHGELLKL